MNTVHADDAWYSGGTAWAYRVKVTINASQVPSTQTNFPAYVNLADLPAGFWSNVNADGSDIRVTNSAGTELAREIESIDADTSAGALWFKADNISDASYYYIYYGNASATEPAASADNGSQKVWDTNYKGVWHMPNGTTLGDGTYAYDSTLNVSNGTLSGATKPSAIAGQIDGAGSFNGSTAYVDMGAGLNPGTSDITLSAWVKTTTLSASVGIIGKAFAGAGQRFELYQSSANLHKARILVDFNGITPSILDGVSPIDDNNWHFIVATLKRDGNMNLYFDGNSEGTPVNISAFAATNLSTGLHFTVGQYFSADQMTPALFFPGSIDEARFSFSARSADWILTEYNNQSSPTTFYQISAQEAVTVPNAPTGLGATAGNLQVSLAWTAPAVDGGSPITDYVIEYKLTSGSSWTQIGHTPSVATSIVVNNLNAGLVNGTSYDFKVSAVNAVGAGSASNIVTATPATIPGAPTIGTATASSTQVSVAFTPLSAPTVAPWYGTTGWTLRKKITIDKTKVPNTNQTNFPVLVSLTGLSNINANGTDIRFTSSDGATELAREIESYADGTLVAWVKVPMLSTSANTDIFMYYGNSSETSEPAADSTYGSQKVWDDGGNNYFKGVWHLPNGTTLTANDSTSNGNNGTLSATPPTAITGKVDGAGNFNGSSNYVNSGDINTIDGATALTVSAWIKTDNTNRDDDISAKAALHGQSQPLVFWRDDAVGAGSQIGNTDALSVLVYDGDTQAWSSSPTGSLGDTNWHYVGFTFTANVVGGLKPYVDGINVNSASTVNCNSIQASANNFVIGAPIAAEGTLNFDGIIDDVRISTVARSADWIATEYNNQSDPASFYEVATEENVADSATNGGSAITNYTVTSSPEGITGTGTTSPIVVSGLTNGTAYTFTVTATNAMGTGPASASTTPVTPATVPGAPTAVTPTYGDRQVSLLWSAPASTGGSAITDYVIEYKLTSAEDIPANWQIYADPETPIIVATAVSGLINGTSYDFRITARNVMGAGTPSSPLVNSTPKTIPGKPIITSAVAGDTQVTVNFTPLSAPTVAPWYGTTGWTLRKKITIDKTKVPNTNQTNFPVLVSLTGLSNINANGTDIRFTSADGATELAREIESYSAGTLVAWVKVPVLSTSANTDIYMYYGNSSETSEPGANSTYGKNNVWDSDYVAVYHFNENATNNIVYDSTSNGFNGTSQNNTSVMHTTGQIGGALNFNGTSDYIIISNPGTIFNGQSLSLEVWATPLQNDSFPRFFDRVYNGQFAFYNTPISSTAASLGGSIAATTTFDLTTGGGPIVLQSTGHFSLTYDKTTAIWYKNSTQSGTSIAASGGLKTSSADITIGNRTEAGKDRPYKGMMDEARISKIARAADWIKTEYNNQSAPGSFYAVAGEENVADSATNGGSEITNYTVTSNPDSVVVSSSTSPIIVTGLTNGTPYTFTMTATNVVGQGPVSDASSPVTPAGVPGIPSGITAVPGNALVDLSWTAPANNGAEITNYVIEYKLHSAPSWTQFGHAVSPLTTISVPDLVNGSLYDFRVYATNSAGTGSPSTPAVESTPRTVPGQPAITGVTRGDGQVTVSFDAPASTGGAEITGYTVTSDPQAITQTGSAPSIVISGLTNATPYTFTVKATNVAGTGVASEPSGFVTPAGVPGKSTEVTAVAGNTQAVVTFVEPLSTGGSAITGYTVSSNNGGTDSNAGSTDLSHTVTGLTNGSSYTFTVVATNDVGAGLASDPSVAITLPTAPTAPLNVATEVKSSSIKLTWSDPASTGGSAITDYVIEYKLTTGGSWAPFDDGVSVDKFATVTGLSNGTSYDFKVSAKNIIGTSSASSVVSANPGEPAQVALMGFSDLTNTSIGTDIKITNEGLIEYEYQYTWCVTTAVDNLCGGGDDIFSASNAKEIEQGHDFDFVATSTVPTPGDYFFHINVLYGSASSYAFSSFTATATFPDPPTGVSAVGGNAQATVSFTIPASNGGSAITNYTVTSNPGALTGTGLTTPIIVTGLTNGTPYTFTMTATNIIGTGLSSSPPSNSVTPMTVPGIISGLTASAGNTQVGLSWAAPASDGGSAITDYVIEYKLTSDSSWSIFAEPISTVTTAIVTGLTNNLSYDFRVKAVNSVGQGPINSTSGTSVEPPPPQINTGGGSSGGRRRIYPPDTLVPVTATTTPIKIVTTTTINNEIMVPKSKVISPTDLDTVQAKTSNTKPSTNEVTATPTETSKISTKAKQEQNSVDDLNRNKVVPWTLINISLLIIALTGLIAFIIRRRRIDNGFN